VKSANSARVCPEQNRIETAVLRPRKSEWMRKPSGDRGLRVW
jgi:hypothetical protein